VITAGEPHPTDFFVHHAYIAAVINLCGIMSHYHQELSKSQPAKQFIISFFGNKFVRTYVLKQLQMRYAKTGWNDSDFETLQSWLQQPEFDRRSLQKAMYSMSMALANSYLFSDEEVRKKSSIFSKDLDSAKTAWTSIEQMDKSSVSEKFLDFLAESWDNVDSDKKIKLTQIKSEKDFETYLDEEVDEDDSRPNDGNTITDIEGRPVDGTITDDDDEDEDEDGDVSNGNSASRNSQDDDGVKENEEDRDTTNDGYSAFLDSIRLLRDLRQELVRVRQENGDRRRQEENANLRQENEDLRPENERRRDLRQENERPRRIVGEVDDDVEEDVDAVPPEIGYQESDDEDDDDDAQEGFGALVNDDDDDDFVEDGDDEADDDDAPEGFVALVNDDEDDSVEDGDDGANDDGFSALINDDGDDLGEEGVGRGGDDDDENINESDIPKGRFMTQALVLVGKHYGLAHKEAKIFARNSGPMYNHMKACQKKPTTKKKNTNYPEYCKFVREFNRTRLTSEEIQEGDCLDEIDENVVKFAKMVFARRLFKNEPVKKDVKVLKEKMKRRHEGEEFDSTH